MRTLIAARPAVAVQGGRPVLLDDGEVVVDAGRIAVVGRGHGGPVDARIDPRDRLLIPGLLSVHRHLGSRPLTRSFLDVEAISPPSFPRWTDG